ncbi:MAG TPA: hypothetical protein VIZ28_14045 [Chitinophagaceae bacterium]
MKRLLCYLITERNVSPAIKGVDLPLSSPSFFIPCLTDVTLKQVSILQQTKNLCISAGMVPEK